jgi:hypothetical protein
MGPLLLWYDHVQVGNLILINLTDISTILVLRSLDAHDTEALLCLLAIEDAFNLLCSLQNSNLDLFPLGHQDHHVIMSSYIQVP